MSSQLPNLYKCTASSFALSDKDINVMPVITKNITDEKVLETLLEHFLVRSARGAEFVARANRYAQLLGHIERLSPEVARQESRIFSGSRVILSVGFSPMLDPDLLHRLLCLVGPGHETVQRSYLHLTKNSVWSRTAHKVRLCSSSSLKGLSARCSALDNAIHASFFQLDIDFAKDRSLSCRVDWTYKVRQIRRGLWGAEAEANVDMTMVYMNVWHGTLGSIFAKIG